MKRIRKSFTTPRKVIEYIEEKRGHMQFSEYVNRLCIDDYNRNNPGDRIIYWEPKEDPYDLCPVCGEKFEMQCKCMRGERTCPNGHSWYRCKHGNVIIGEVDHSRPYKCDCKEED
jgi:hypothetical protein